MKNIAYFYAWYTSGVIRVVRGVLLLGLLGLLWYFRFLEPGKIALVCLSWFLMLETYFHFKVCKINPWLSVSENKTDRFFDSCTLKTLVIVLTSSTTQDILTKLYKEESVQFVLKHAGIKWEEMPIIEVSKETLIQNAYPVCERVHGIYITPIDVIASYLFMIEPTKHLLFSKELKTDEFLHILTWARHDFPKEERNISSKMAFIGEGIGEEMVYGWTIEIQKYMLDITKKLGAEKPTLIGRSKEYKEVVEALSKKEKSNVLLVGEAGSGKTSIVKHLAYESYAGVLSGPLYHKRFFELLTGAFMAGVVDEGTLAKRLQEVIDELKHAGNVVIFIPEFENILGVSTFKVDLSGVLLPYLRDSSIKIIATTTPGIFKETIEHRSELVDEFEVVRLDAPDIDSAVEMLLESGERIEKSYNITLSYKAVVTSVLLASRYLQHKALPGSAMRLLEDAASSVAHAKGKIVHAEDVERKTEEITHTTISAPTIDEKALLLGLEKELHKRVIGQDVAIKTISDAMRRIRAGMNNPHKPFSFLFLGPTGVGKTETAKAFAASYFGSDTHMIRLDMSEYSGESGIKRLLGAPPGEGNERGELTDKIFENPFSLVLLDEFEKADAKILNLFLQIFEDGRLTDNKGRTVSFSNAIIIATSNAGAEFIREHIQDTDLSKKLIEYIQTQRLFKPELLNRFDGLVVFKLLNADELKQVVKLLLQDVAIKMKEKDIAISFDESVISKIAEAGYDLQFGARPLRRYIQDTIEEELSRELLNDMVRRGESVRVILDVNGKISFQKLH